MRVNKELRTMSLPQLPKTTTYSNKWALNNFDDRRKEYPDPKYPDDLIQMKQMVELTLNSCHSLKTIFFPIIIKTALKEV